ncbi:MAG: DUF6054 family protein [Bacilli bacterium]
MAKDTFVLEKDIEVIAKSLRDTSSLGTLVHDQTIEIPTGGEVRTLIFERYFIRTSSQGALIVTLDSVSGLSEGKIVVTAVSTGTSEGFFFKIDWGASEQYIYDLCGVLGIKRG